MTLPYNVIYDKPQFDNKSGRSDGSARTVYSVLPVFCW